MAKLLQTLLKPGAAETLRGMAREKGRWRLKPARRFRLSFLVTHLAIVFNSLGPSLWL
ncbi:MAG: hypothetical protein QXI87_09720 [Thermoproteota archaeon]